MTTFRSALIALADLTVPGVSGNHDIDAVPDDLNRGQLPVLLVLPIDDSRSLFEERGGGFEALAFSGGGKTVTYTLTHLLVVAPASAGRGLRSHLPTLVDLIDAYFGALDVTLGGVLDAPAQVRVEPGIHPYGEVNYVGCAFRHTWTIRV